MRVESGSRESPHSAIVAAALLVAAAVSCGKKADPRPPIPPVPARMADVAVQQEGFDAVVAFRQPERLADGGVLLDLSRVDVYRLVNPGPELLSAPPPSGPGGASGERAPLASERRRAKALRLREQGFFQTARKVASLSLERLAELARGARISYRDPLEPFFQAEAPPPTLAYAVVAERRGGQRSEVSNLATLEPAVPPGAPRLLRVSASEGEICLEWRAPEKNRGATVGGYNIYRRRLEEPGYAEPINPKPVEEASYIDTLVAYGSSYLYTVRAVATGHPNVEGPESDEDGIAFRDLYPPPPVARLDALAESGVVRLVWDPVSSPDLAGYDVFRSSDGEPPEKLNEGPVAETLFADRAVRPGRRYRYWVRAVDRAGNQSPDSPAAEAETF